ncbi:hypothetical protein [uncultured Bacteroides sp.]|uniref:hypothetical protein n=1 Tax=uncultured Bacteroides sp. TaxID=162156 RepID=UPI0025FBDCAD|nr:hypothetical protein [uncultured Bacteroides sp.]
MEDYYKESIHNYNNEHRETPFRTILERGICYPVDNPIGEILLVGANPSFSGGYGDFSFKLSDTDDSIRYWERIKDMMGDLLPCTAYLDLFPIKCSNQKEFEEQCPIDLKVRLLQVTQLEIERIHPKLIIVLNKFSRYYWGINSDCTWMGYKFERLPFEGKDIELYRITGLREESDRILTFSPSVLVGTIVIFYGLYDERHVAKSPQKILSTTDIIKVLLNNLHK